MTKLSAGLIGMGIMGNNHARVLASLAGINFLGFVDPSEKFSNDQNKSRFKKYADLPELLAMKPDYCIIASPTETHEEIALQVLEAGASCLIEKPISSNFESAKKISDFAQRKSLVVGVGHIERYNPAIVKLKNELMNNNIGDIRQISTRRQGPFTNRTSKSGVVSDLVTHDIDLVIWLGSSSFKSIYTQAISMRNKFYEDAVSVTGMLKSNVIVNILANRINPYKDRSITIIGENYTYEADTMKSTLIRYSSAEQIVINKNILGSNTGLQSQVTNYTISKSEPLLTEHENFRDYLLSKKSNIITINEILEVTKVTDAIIQSSSTGLVVEF